MKTYDYVKDIKATVSESLKEKLRSAKDRIDDAFCCSCYGVATRNFCVRYGGDVADHEKNLRVLEQSGELISLTAHGNTYWWPTNYLNEISKGDL